VDIFGTDILHEYMRGVAMKFQEWVFFFFLRCLMGDMQLDRSEDMSEHVSTCISYDVFAWTPVACKLWCWLRRVFLRLVAKISDPFLEKQINIKSPVKYCCRLMGEKLSKR
jgi:hypothetical protein